MVLNVMVYVDYENIETLLANYGIGIPENEFFKVIQAKLKDTGLNIIDIIVYGNFEKNVKQQTTLRSMGLQTRHASSNGKNSSDLELTADALRDLFKNPNIDVFTVISSDRDIIPLLKQIKYENKITYVLSTRIGFNQVVARYADFHEYLEDILGIALSDGPVNNQPLTDDSDDDLLNPSQEDIAKAQEVARCFYESHIWMRASILSKPVTLKGYIGVVTKTVNRSPDQVIKDFKLAHRLKLITLYQVSDRGLCIREGEKMNELD
jgi:hypothetical protein